MTAEELKDRQAEIPKDKLIVFYCNTGVIAEVAYHTLRELGYSNVKFVNAKVTFDKNGTYTVPPGTIEALNKYLKLAPTGGHAADVQAMLDALKPAAKPKAK